MKVSLPKGYRKLFTLEDLANAKATIAAFKEIDATPAEYGEMAVRAALKHRVDCIDRIIEAKAVVMPYYHLDFDWNGEGTGFMDAKIQVIAKTYQGFIEVHAMFSEINQIGATDFEPDMYVNYAKSIA